MLRWQRLLVLLLLLLLLLLGLLLLSLQFRQLFIFLVLFGSLPLASPPHFPLGLLQCNSSNAFEFGTYR